MKALPEGKGRHVSVTKSSKGKRERTPRLKF